MRLLLLLFAGLAFQAISAFAQESGASLRQCFRIAEQNNLAIQQMQQSVQTRRYNKQAEQLNRLPDVDLLANYTYLGEPLRINLQTARQGIVKGTAQQNVNAAKQVYRQITGKSLPKDVQDKIYRGAKDVIEDLYPEYNPELSRQHYFTAGLGLRWPLYLGGKLHAAKKVAKAKFKSGQLNLQLTQNTVSLAIASEYMHIRYLNAMLNKQKQLVQTYQKTKRDAASLVKNEIIPPYQKHWADVALSQATTNLKKHQLDKENALLTLQNLVGSDSALAVNKTLEPVRFPLPHAYENSWKQNPQYRWLQSQSKVADAAVDVTRSGFLPNVFLIGSYQFNRKDLPVIIPNWMVGVGLQWNLFSSLKNINRTKASKSLVKESRILQKQKKKSIRLKVKSTRNKLQVFKEQMKTLDQARSEAAKTTQMVRRRLKNKLSSVKDVNDALKVQLEAEKAYYTAVLAYNIAVATYLEMKGRPQKIVDYMH
jgi:outer membrane protein TolC